MTVDKPDFPKVDLPLFKLYPELLATPPVLRYDELGRFYIEWRAQRGSEGVILVLHAIVPHTPLWSYAISDDSTNTIRHYAGKHCDPAQDPMVNLEQRY